MERRRLMLGGAFGWGVSGLLAGCAASLPPAARPGAAPRPVDAADLALLNRVTWGVDSAVLAQWSRGSRRDFLQAQLHPGPVERLPAAAQAQIDAQSSTRQPMAAWVLELDQRRRDADATLDDEAKKAAQQAYQQELNRLAREAAARMLLRALYSPSQLQEQLAWFWFNHFNVHQYKGNLRVMVGDYQDRLRRHALGKFSDLLIASATHPAMIRYLDNEQNAVNRLNENYAREVMELHTLGVDGGYTQKDVQELARVLTGLGINQSGKTPDLKPALQPLYVADGLTAFNPARHDMGDKWVLGQRVAGRGWEEILQQLGRLARHPATARHVSRQLATCFAADQPPPALVDRMSRAFSGSDGDIAVTLGAMFDAPEFAPTLGHKFKDPVHYVVSSVRLAYDGRTVLNCGPMIGWLNRLGEGLYNRQTPDGYSLVEEDWAGSGQMSTRFDIARAIGAGSAGLFRAEGASADAPAFPQLSNAVYHDVLAPTFGERTRVALDGASSPQEWNALLLSSPEFMYR
ncbi:MAG: DUF1800 domain-containing protein [Pseudomonadota bacterium]|nr:DUF1800 domain-containing protein [Pseudomonadota bacterium]